MAKKKRVLAFAYKPTKDDLAAMTICNDNHCYIYPLPLDNAGTRYKLEVYRPKKVNPKNRYKTDSKVYESIKCGWYKKIFELYNHLKKDYVEKESKTKAS